MPTNAAIARRDMMGMTPGFYVCTITDYGDGPCVGEWFHARTSKEANATARMVRANGHTVSTIFVK